MQVLGDLIGLPIALSSLPLPWWHRAPLGLLHKTGVFYAVLDNPKRPVGDVVVSVLPPHEWERLLRVECVRDDKPGIIAELFKAVYPLNVALAETVTIEMGTKHHATVICETPAGDSTQDHVVPIMQRLQQSGFIDPLVIPFFQRTPLAVKFLGVSQVQHGWLHGLKLKEWFDEKYTDGARAKVDLASAVVSADTDKRILRYVFPMQGARTLRVTHADKPGALKSIFDEIAKFELNVLSTFLRRGGHASGTAELVCVVEPQKEWIPGESDRDLQRAIKGIAPDYCADPVIREKIAPEKVVYVPDPRSIVPGVKPQIVVRYWGGAEHTQLPDVPVLKCLKEVLEDSGYASIIGRAGPRSSDPAMALLSASDGCALVLNTVDYSQEGNSIELGIEIGRLRASGKPLLLVVKKAAVGNSTPLSSLKGAAVTLLCYESEDLKSQELEGFRSELRGWLANVSAHRGDC